METYIMHLLRGVITGCLFAGIVMSLASKVIEQELDYTNVRAKMVGQMPARAVDSKQMVHKSRPSSLTTMIK